MLWTILTLVFVVASEAALAASHHVYPGPNALQTAIDGAAAGDRVLVHPSPGGYGVYAEAVTVDKPLQIIGNGVVVTGDCTGSIPMTIAGALLGAADILVRAGGTGISRSRTATASAYSIAAPVSCRSTPRRTTTSS